MDWVQTSDQHFSFEYFQKKHKRSGNKSIIKIFRIFLCTTGMYGLFAFSLGMLTRRN